jgi:predicted metal-dependent phosphoesterase TrpH
VRVVIVSPYPWDRPATGTEHARALGEALARRGDDVVILAPARSSALLREGRGRLRALGAGDPSSLTPPPGEPLVVAVGFALELSPSARSLPISVPARAAIAVVLGEREVDVIELIDPDLLGTASAVLRRASAPMVATFTRPPVLHWGRLRSRLAAVRALTAETASALGGEATVGGIAVDPAFVRRAEADPPTVIVDAGLSDAPMLRALAAELEPTAAVVELLGTKPLRVAQVLATGAVRARSIRVVRAGSAAVRADHLGRAALLVAGEGGTVSVGAEALAAGLPVVATAEAPAATLLVHGETGFVAASDQPELVAAYAGRLLAEAAERRAVGARAVAASRSADSLAADSAELYASVARIRPETAGSTAGTGPSETILCDFHLHTDASSDCATTVPELVQRAIELGLGAIAVTDHNSIAGGLAARAYVAEHDLPLHVVVGSEVKTATGEVIGLYLDEDVPRGLPFADTVAAIRAQGAVVYVPHPFDRRHAIPDADLLARLVDELDVIEVANGRLLRESYNDEALAFAERHALLQGAGSDEHVIEGLGSAVVELPRFDDAESLLAALAHGRIRRRPTSFYQLQALKLARQARKRIQAR